MRCPRSLWSRFRRRAAGFTLFIRIDAVLRSHRVCTLQTIIVFSRQNMCNEIDAVRRVPKPYLTVYCTVTRKMRTSLSSTRTSVSADFLSSKGEERASTQHGFRLLHRTIRSRTASFICLFSPHLDHGFEFGCINHVLPS